MRLSNESKKARFLFVFIGSAPVYYFYYAFEELFLPDVCPQLCVLVGPARGMAQKGGEGRVITYMSSLFLSTLSHRSYLSQVVPSLWIMSVREDPICLFFKVCADQILLYLTMWKYLYLTGCKESFASIHPYWEIYPFLPFEMKGPKRIFLPIQYNWHDLYFLNIFHESHTLFVSLKKLICSAIYRRKFI